MREMRQDEIIQSEEEVFALAREYFGLDKEQGTEQGDRRRADEQGSAA